MWLTVARKRTWNQLCHRLSSKEAPVSVPTITLSCYHIRYITGLDTCGFGHTAVKKCSTKLAHDKIASVVPVETQLVTTV